MKGFWGFEDPCESLISDWDPKTSKPQNLKTSKPQNLKPQYWTKTISSSGRIIQSFSRGLFVKLSNERLLFIIVKVIIMEDRCVNPTPGHMRVFFIISNPSWLTWDKHVFWVVSDWVWRQHVVLIQNKLSVQIGMWSTLMQWEIGFEVISDKFLVFRNGGVDQNLIFWIENFFEVFSGLSLLFIKSPEVTELYCENMEGLELLECSSERSK